jgi:putative transposase
VSVSRWWPSWCTTLILVKPQTVVAWHRKGFRLFWAYRSRRRGRPRVNTEIHALVRQMAQANVAWGAPRIHGELLKLGFQISQATVSRYMPKRRRPRSQTWRTFLDNHLGCLASVDFFVVPTATFGLLFTFLVLWHERRRVVHFNVTASPTARWTAEQIIEAFPEDSAPRYMVRDRDSIYGAEFVARIKGMGIEEVLTAPRSPWQNPFVERLIGSIRRECLDHVIVLGEQHLRRVLASYFEYYHGSRIHLSLGKDAPDKCEVESPHQGTVVALPKVGGLHHHYAGPHDERVRDFEKAHVRHDMGCRMPDDVHKHMSWWACLNERKPATGHTAPVAVAPGTKPKKRKDARKRQKAARKQDRRWR